MDKNKFLLVIYSEKIRNIYINFDLGVSIKDVHTQGEGVRVKSVRLLTRGRKGFQNCVVANYEFQNYRK